MAVSNPATFLSVRTEFSATGSSNSMYGYRRGGGIVGTSFTGVGDGSGGDPLKLSQFNGLSAVVNTSFSMAVGYSILAVKGNSTEWYGFGETLSLLGDIKGILSPSTFKGKTVTGINCVLDNAGGPYPIDIIINSVDSNTFVTHVTMSGVEYAINTNTQGYRDVTTTTINISTAVFTVSSTTGFTNDMPVTLSTNGALPTGITAATKYYVRDITSTTFKLSATSGGAAITLSGSQSGTHNTQYNIYTSFSHSPGANTNRTGGVASFTPTISIASPGVVTKTSHGLVNTDRVTFQTTGSLPTGIIANSIYFVVGTTTNTFKVSLTSGGADINTSGSQSGTHTGFEVVTVALKG